MSIAWLTLSILLTLWVRAVLLGLRDGDPRIDLTGRWRMTHFPEGAYAPELVLNLKDGELRWRPARVPGAGQLDLIEAGEIPDPVRGRATDAFRALEKEEWWFVREFEVPADWKGARVELELEGVDTFGDVWLNDRRVSRVENMFIPHRLDVTEDLRPGAENRIAVRILSPTRAVAGKDLSGTAVWGSVERLWARKVQASYGWDIHPRLLVSGLWRPVALVRRGPCSIAGYAFRTLALSQEAAQAVVVVDLELPRRTPRALAVRITGSCGSSRFRARAAVRGRQVEVRMEIVSPRIWWPRDLGEPSLYDLRIELLREGEAIHAVADRTGIRTIELRQNPVGGEGTEFTLVVNGIPTFARGVNCGPLDAFPCRGSDHVPALLDLLAESGANTVRLWGGGFYPDAAFYEGCDERGILIWQDFMFASAGYPPTPEFEKIARTEVEATVARLRNHPSIALWCGDSEVERVLAEGTEGGEPRHPKTYRLTRKVIPEILARLDPTRPYWPSSPHSPADPSRPSRLEEGDVHLRPDGDLSGADEGLAQARFVSEIGCMAAPDVATLRACIPPQHLWPPDREVWILHAGGLPDRLGGMEAGVRAVFGDVPDTLGDYVEASQYVQAEALKRWIEAMRRRKVLRGEGWDASGILIWHLIDAWPQLSEALVDARHRRKEAFAYVARSLAPVALAFGEVDGTGLTLFGFNDTARPQATRYSVHALDPKGEKRGETRGTAELPPNESVRITRLAWRDLGTRAFTPALLLVQSRLGPRVLVNHYLHTGRPIALADYRALMDGAEGFAGWA